MDITDYNDYISAFDDDEVDEGIRKALAGGKTFSVTVDGTETTYNGTENKSVTVNISSKISEHNAASTAHSELFAGKVDAETGKGLSSNDYTDEEKSKLSGIASGAQVNTINSVNGKTGAVVLDAADVSAIPISEKGVANGVPTLDSSGKVPNSQINIDNFLDSLSENAVSNFVVANELAKKVNAVTGKGLSTNDYTTNDKNKLSGIESGAQVNIIESVKLNGTALVPDENKTVNVQPAISDVSGLSDALSGKQDAINDLSTIRGGAALGATAIQPEGNAGFHNSVYRGKYLGTTVTADQWAAIGAGTFDDLYIGDYWTINSVNWRIAAFDYWYKMGNVECTTHHVVIVPDTVLLAGNGTTTQWMNAEASTVGAYVGSGFYSSYDESTKTAVDANGGKAQCVSMINSAFGADHILIHREILKNTVAGNYESSGAWYDSTVELMSEQMVFGSRVFGSCANGTAVPFLHTIGNSQLPLFALDHSKICTRSYWWLRDVASNTAFAYVGHEGTCNYRTANDKYCGVRPVFGIQQSDQAL